MRGAAELRRLVRSEFSVHRDIVLGVDFDGTLSPLARRPALARLPAATRGLLERLAGNPRVLLAVVSGRRLSDITRRVGLGGLHYSGNHGLEIRGPGLAWRHPAARKAAGLLRRLAARLARLPGDFPGVQLENKGLSLSVHYRQLDPALAPALRRFVAGELRSFSGSLALSQGKMVWEIKPRVRWNKGHALLRIARARRRSGLVLFIGDDRTDEEGFRVLGRRAVTVRVGPVRRSRARFILRRQAEVLPLLRFLNRAAC